MQATLLRLAAFGGEDYLLYPTSRMGSGNLFLLSPDGSKAYISNYSMYGSGWGPEGSDECQAGNHYDRSYVTEVEGYPGLIVHGPLLATLLIDLLREHRPDASVVRFTFRASSPLFDIDPFFVCGEPASDDKTVRLWAKDHRGGLAMEATAIVA